jgi:hypothetical protein
VAVGHDRSKNVAAMVDSFRTVVRKAQTETGEMDLQGFEVAIRSTLRSM